jgi:hypothetical protein
MYPSLSEYALNKFSKSVSYSAIFLLSFENNLNTRDNFSSFFCLCSDLLDRFKKCKSGGFSGLSKVSAIF